MLRFMPVGAYGYHLTAKLAVSLQDLGVRVRPAKSVFQTRSIPFPMLIRVFSISSMISEYSAGQYAFARQYLTM